MTQAFWIASNLLTGLFPGIKKHDLLFIFPLLIPTGVMYVQSNCSPRLASPNHINLLKPSGHVMHQQFDIQQLYALPTLYLCILYLSENKQRLVPLTA